ncbi:MAG: PEP-CTERM sorting domain-containing protein [Planctomycetaceae bacterium]
MPEPGTVTFAGVAIALVGLRHWRRRSAAAAV